MNNPVLKVEIDTSHLEKVIAEAVEQAIKRHSMVNSLPPMLSRIQLCEFLGIKETKASELMNRQDFPVIREFGYPKVPTHLLFKWIDGHTEWMQKNAQNSWSIKGA
ncbi:DNA-binding protein [Paenibacillus sp. CGMCC 1.16610]|uniref:DNA-binding protein n=1 Tax=Paenibacillus anseongense TaxID=2682845 RepID=A0ABW9U3R6_9BACL|nr:MULTISPECIES: DNA-binding protein [Paenibacillus]MBA2943184.1 DNA-binding protein [Paenibacillus sp. CGMCC 1.16610]MVQ33681.1 DNA-binding protein [Paenibacillus anseongense]